jgi:hypothetical protein
MVHFLASGLCLVTYLKVLSEAGVGSTYISHVRFKYLEPATTITMTDDKVFDSTAPHEKNPNKAVVIIGYNCHKMER